jgi:hypothetical protein
MSGPHGDLRREEGWEVSDLSSVVLGWISGERGGRWAADEEEKKGVLADEEERGSLLMSGLWRLLSEEVWPRRFARGGHWWSQGLVGGGLSYGHQWPNRLMLIFQKERRKRREREVGGWGSGEGRWGRPAAWSPV